MWLCAFFSEKYLDASWNKKMSAQEKLQTVWRGLVLMTEYRWDVLEWNVIIYMHFVPRTQAIGLYEGTLLLASMSFCSNLFCVKEFIIYFRKTRNAWPQDVTDRNCETTKNVICYVSGNTKDVEFE